MSWRMSLLQCQAVRRLFHKWTYLAPISQNRSDWYSGGKDDDDDRVDDIRMVDDGDVK